jgi:CDP-diacylglycerol pyrophosphatase
LWGDDWGIALNADMSRTQCHTHMHIGKLLPDVEADAQNTALTVVDGAAAIPVPPDGGGMWIHPVNGKLHVHYANIAEPVLMR